MKFFLDFMSCCGPTGGEGYRRDMPESNGRRWEETRALVITTRRSRRRKRSITSPSGTAAADWKPTLCSISEDNVVMAGERGERAVKRKGSSGTSGGGAPRNAASIGNYNEDYRSSNQFTAIPTFSATPFMI